MKEQTNLAERAFRTYRTYGLFSVDVLAPLLTFGFVLTLVAAVLV